MFGVFARLSEREANNMSAVTLAFVGDAVYSLYVREKYVLGGDFPPAKLQKLTSAEVSAHGQSELLTRLLPLLTPEETDIFRRGRNAKKPSHSKNATIAEYNVSTGFEAVLGYLYLTGNIERIAELLGNKDGDNT